MVSRTIIQDEVIQIKRNPWTDNFFRPLLIIIMIMSLNISIVNLVRLANPAWRGTYFLLGMLLTTVEALYSYRVLHHYRSRGISVMRYRVAEATTLIIILKLLSFMDKPLAQISAELQAMWQVPWLFFTIEFYIILALAMFTWLAASNTIADFEALYDPYSDNRMPLDSLAERFFWGGGILVVVSGVTQWVTRYGASSLVDWQRPALTGVIFNVLVYFLLGLVLLSQVNLTRLQVRWGIQKITVASGLGKQWAKYGFMLLGLIAFFAFLLPTSYSLGLLATIGFGLQYLIAIFAFLVQLLILLFTFPFAWLLSLLGATPRGAESTPPPALPPVFEGSSGPSPPWWEVLRSLIFWLVALGLVGYLIKSYLEDHPGLVDYLKKMKFLGPLIELLAEIWQRITGWAKAGLELIPKKGEGSDKGRAAPKMSQVLDWLGLRDQSPRQRILSYYLNILRRAEREGSSRKAHQTPYEYEPKLQQSVPDVETEVHLLTDVFVHARYSRDNFSEEQAGLVKILWQSIRKALRGDKERSGDSNGSPLEQQANDTHLPSSN